jgi:AraC family transcriptional regulator
LAKIAEVLNQAVVQRQQDGKPGTIQGQILAAGEGWTVTDVLCTSGPQDKIFEEEHRQFSIAMVVAGTFQYRSPSGRALLSPGALLLGGAGQCFECGHEHATGDRCISFKYDAEYFRSLARDVGCRYRFNIPSIPALKIFSLEFATLSAALESCHPVPWEEFVIHLAAKVLHMAGEQQTTRDYHPGSAARVTRIIRAIEHEPDGEWTISRMAAIARLSPYHFLRVFQEQIGITPHQFLLRTRLRNAAARIASAKNKVLDIALDSGFGDISNFNRAFRGEFGASPRKFHVLIRKGA